MYLTTKLFQINLLLANCTETEKRALLYQAGGCYTHEEREFFRITITELEKAGVSDTTIKFQSLGREI